MGHDDHARREQIAHHTDQLSAWHQHVSQLALGSAAAVAVMQQLAPDGNYLLLATLAVVCFVMAAVAATSCSRIAIDRAFGLRTGADASNADRVDFWIWTVSFAVFFAFGLVLLAIFLGVSAWQR